MHAQCTRFPNLGRGRNIRAMLLRCDQRWKHLTLKMGISLTCCIGLVCVMTVVDSFSPQTRLPGNHEGTEYRQRRGNDLMRSERDLITVRANKDAKACTRWGKKV